MILLRLLWIEIGLVYFYLVRYLLYILLSVRAFLDTFLLLRWGDLSLNKDNMINIRLVNMKIVLFRVLMIFLFALSDGFIFLIN